MFQQNMTKTKLIHWVSLKVFNENFLPFICPRPLVLGDTNPIPSPFTPGVPLSSHHCTKSWKITDITSILLYRINGIEKRGKLLKFGNEKKISEFRSRGKEIVKSLHNLKEIGKYSQEPVSQFDKNTAFHGA